MKTKKVYWHELTQEEQTNAIKRDALVSEFLQPEWCSHPDALRGRMGCWSLVDEKKLIGEISDCGTCQYIKES